RYFEAKAAEDIARTSQAQLEEQQQLVLARVKAGTATNADKLRLDVAISNAKLQAIQAQALQATARTALFLGMGITPSKDIDFAQPKELEARALTKLTETEAMDQAARDRHEVARAQKEQQAASKHATTSYMTLTPEVALENAYTNLQ